MNKPLNPLFIESLNILNLCKTFNTGNIKVTSYSSPKLEKIGPITYTEVQRILPLFKSQCRLLSTMLLQANLLTDP